MEHKPAAIGIAIGGAMGIVATTVPEIREEVLRLVADLTGWGDPKKVLNKIKTNFGDLINKWSASNNVPKSIIGAVIAYESGGDPNVGRHEPSGTRCSGMACVVQPGDTGVSYGLMQIMNWHYTGDPRDLLKPDLNIQKGTSILTANFKKYNEWHLAVAAYNCGQGGVDNAIKKAGTSDWQTLVEKKALPSYTLYYLRRLFGKGGIYYASKEIFV